MRVARTAHRMITAHVLKEELAARASKIRELSERIGAIKIIRCQSKCASRPASDKVCVAPPEGMELIVSNEIQLPYSDGLSGVLSDDSQRVVAGSVLSKQLAEAVACRICPISSSCHKKEGGEVGHFTVVFFRKKSK